MENKSFNTVNRPDFEVPEGWNPIQVTGIYGIYSYAGSEKHASDHVVWNIIVSRQDWTPERVERVLN